MAPKSHILPFFTRRDREGREQAVCGAFVTASELGRPETRPDCWGCAVWLDNLDVIAPAPARVIATISPETPWGDERIA